MRYIAAYLLAVLGGNTTPSENEIARILSSSGVESDSARIQAVLKAMEGKSVEEVIAAGSNKLASFGSAAAPAAGGAAAAGGEAAKVEEKVVEEEEEVDMGGGMDMFGGGDEDY